LHLVSPRSSDVRYLQFGNVAQLRYDELSPFLFLVHASLKPIRSAGTIDYNNLVFPAKMRVDWIRVWQQKDKIDSEFPLSQFPVLWFRAELTEHLELYTVGCDPEANPTVQYINDNPVSSPLYIFRVLTASNSRTRFAGTLLQQQLDDIL
jgi:hypothetical protein